MKVQVGPASQDKDSFFATFIWFITKILIVPAERNCTGAYEFRILSWRYFFCFLVWSFTPSSLNIIILATEASGIMAYLRNTSNFNEIVGIVFYQMFYFLNIMLLMANPICMGYLVAKCSDLSKYETLTSRKMEIISFTIGLISAVIMLGLEENNVTQTVFYFISCWIQGLLTVIAMILYNTYVTTFVNYCKQIQNLPIERKGFVMKQLLIKYSHLKVGLGPISMLWYIYTVINLVSWMYGGAQDPNLPILILLISFIIKIWNISACCQEAYEALQSAGQVLRYVDIFSTEFHFTTIFLEMLLI